MLNYVWISLLLIGIFTAVGRDINDEVSNTYRNGIPLTVHAEITGHTTALHPSYHVTVVIPAAAYNDFYGTSETVDIRQPVVIPRWRRGK